MSDRTQDIKNLRAVATACKNYTDKKIEDLRWELGTYDLGVESDNTSALVKTMPSGTIKANVNKIYGASEKSENLLVIADKSTTTANGITYSISNGVITLNGTATSDTIIVLNSSVSFNVESYTIRDLGNFYIADTCYCYVNNLWQNFTSSGETFSVSTAQNQIIYLYVKNGTTLTNDISKPMLVKGSTAPTEFKVGYEGIHNIELTGIKSEGKQLLDIPNVASTITEGMTYSITGGEVSINGTPSGAYKTCYSKMITDTMSPNATYTLNSNSNCICYAQISITNMDDTITRYYSEGTTPRTFTLPSQYKSVWFNIQNGATASLITNGSVKPVIVRGSTTPTDFVPYVQPITKTIDLTSIEDSGGNKLFPNGKLMGNENVKDLVGVYNQESKWNEVVLNGTENNWNMYNTGQFSIALNPAPKSNTPNFKWSPTDIWQNTNLGVRPSISIESNLLVFRTTAYDGGSGIDNIADWKAYLQAQPITIQYERVTYLTSNTDLSATLRNIQGYSNGSITAQNTYDMATTSEIDYLVEEVKA